MAKYTNSNKKSNARKLVPAVGMLAVSAVMLSTSTYAWFTMSKDVEVKGIQLTATTPDLIEISFGKVGSGETNLSIPGEGASDPEWVHSAATGSIYSSFGKIKPASSVDGQTLYYTDNATKFGKEVSASAEFSLADTAVTKTVINGAKVTEETGTPPSATDTLGEEGYYVDIPVWFRTTKNSAVTLGVSAKFENTEDGATNNYELYNAARVAILDPNNTSDASSDVSSSSTTKGVIMNGSNAKYYNNYRPATITEGDLAVNKAKSDGTATELSTAYDAVVPITQTVMTGGSVTTKGTTVATVAGRTSAQTSGYSSATKKIIRVWLEGEDEACWNEHAAQDFVISLTFYDITDAT